MTGTHRWPALLVLCAGSLMIILDGSIVAVALPAIQDDLGFPPAGLAWVVNAYLVAFGGLLLLAGRLGDLLGRRQVFLAGVALFTLASLACAAATGPATLVTARFVQGVGGALTTAVALGMIVRLFPEPAERARAIAVFAFTGAAGASLGLLAGGVLTDLAGWRAIFLINLPIGGLILVAGIRLVVRDLGIGLRAGLDVAGALLATAGLMATVLAIVGAGEHGWTSARTLGAAGLAAVLLAGFAARQRAAATPLLPPHVLRAPGLIAANAVQFLMVAAYFGFQFLLALHLQLVLGLGAAATGFAFLPTPLAIAAVSLGLAGRLVGRLGARRVLVGGLALAVVGFLLLARLPVDAGYARDVLPALLVFGAAGGLTLPAVTTLAMAGAAPADAGLASGLANTTQQVGGALGLAVLATLAASRTDALRAAGTEPVTALAAGYRSAFAVAAALVTAALLLALLSARRPAPVPVTATPVSDPTAVR
ncbi:MULTISPECIES: MFS transporter [Micromonospora]|uniref:MFS transporter n=1 Tax=Micromonospora solifontis TaxID=2487138 RepID=A0ABX9WAD4_9ACTN|nr:MULTISPECIES: MFS transporter [Micromonospora]NES16980.1 MFS transporter [Micromonospora sp. PPF5-17B]NES39028.1 MFS transporter [Micromonospora solifontis]NES58706.1 MFS transporter [Micromonospora sp. PPF5-6]RNL91955.1 MFS transporter [Micromonospora solifontis]